MKTLILAVVAVASVASFAAAQRRQPSSTPVTGYSIVRIYPHDPKAFTQGLVYLDGFLYEGTGLHGQSTVRKVKLENGEVVQVQKIDDRHFGEGIAVVGNELFQLTWQSGVGFVYDRTTFQRTRTFTYHGEGWGLTYDGTRLILSDGSETGTLRFIDPKTLKETGRLKVTETGKPVAHLNELEMVKGELLANVWLTDRIARINPKTGVVTGWIDLTGLLDPRDRVQDSVLNGIAYDAAGDRLFVTGKLWPKVFEIRLK